MVDVISHGRLDVGFARAWLPYEFEALGVPLDTSRARYEATIRAVLRLWSEDKVTEDTTFFSFRDATSLPPVVQRPHPPVWGAATRSRQSFEWLGRQGFGLLVSPSPLRKDLAYTRELVRSYRETFTAVHGSSGRQPQVAVSLPMFVAETDEAAYQEAIPYLRDYLSVTTEAARSWSRVRSTNYAGYESMADSFGQVSDEALRHGGTAVVGSVETVISSVRELVRDLSADVCLWQVDFGGQRLDSMERSLRLFVDRVLPAVRD
jgi:alkanesulfonate monooxygenase SsuD/methylene tetrahydromethanopterin reductase-like flavin-dependent oxidoreductase (luciferase family)